MVAPVEKRADCARVGLARIFISDVGREELDEAPRRALAGSGDHHRQIQAGRYYGNDFGCLLLE
jgi:hypothetical protein